MIPGYGGLVLLAVGLAHGSSKGQQLFLAVGPLIVGAVVVIGAGMWLVNNRPSPFWGRVSDIIDVMLIVALVPLALGVAGVLGFVRGHA